MNNLFIESEKAFYKFWDEMQKINTITNPIKQMEATLKLRSIFEEVYSKGYDSGFKEGEKYANVIKQN
jgi:hypothetical protein